MIFVIIFVFILSVSLIFVTIESFRYLPLYVNTKKITTLIMLAVLFVGAAFVIYEFGFHFDELDTYTQLAFIRTMMLIIMPTTALTLDFMKSIEDDKLRKEERDYQDKMYELRKAEERLYQDLEQIEEREYQEELENDRRKAIEHKELEKRLHQEEEERKKIRETNLRK
ncbi:MAG: hypothetical protein FWC68_06220 [Oscillospiraceae bacterium]|nr:hypothetical protein [Oscillospiraceae bacterium]